MRKLVPIVSHWKRNKIEMDLSGLYSWVGGGHYRDEDVPVVEHLLLVPLLVMDSSNQNVQPSDALKQ